MISDDDDDDSLSPPAASHQPQQQQQQGPGEQVPLTAAELDGFVSRVLAGQGDIKAYMESEWVFGVGGVNVYRTVPVQCSAVRFEVC